MAERATCARSRVRLLPALLLLALPMFSGCTKKSTSPATLFDGHVTLAAGQTGDVNQSQVQLYYTDPFAPGATPYLVATATGTATNATFSFGGLAAGEFYVVASKGSLRGWYNGARNGAGSPVASVIQLLHGESRSVSISMQ